MIKRWNRQNVVIPSLFSSGWDYISLSAGVTSLVLSVKHGDVLGAVIDSVGIVADATALIVPGLPGGAGVGIKAIHNMRKAADVTDVVGGAREIKQGIEDKNGLQVAVGTFQAAAGVGGIIKNVDVAEACSDIDFSKIDDIPKGTGKAVEWTNHGFKHFAPKNMSWKNVVKSTKNGPAKYLHGTDVEALEQMVWKYGTDVTNGKAWKVMEFDEVIGACSGKNTKYMRVEFSSSTIHGHPITKSEYNKLLK